MIGCDSERSADVLRQIYAPLTEGTYYERADAIPQPDRASIPAPIIVTTTKSAELIKHASNAFLAMKISFINAVACVCESVGASVNQVVHGIGTDSRIGRRFLSPGIAFVNSAYEAAHNADALLILTEWEEFANLDLISHEWFSPNSLARDNT